MAERSEGLRSLSPASSRMCHVGLLPLHAVTTKGWHSPTSSRMQQARFLRHVVGDGREQPRSAAYFTPAGRELGRRAVRYVCGFLSRRPLYTGSRWQGILAVLPLP